MTNKSIEELFVEIQSEWDKVNKIAKEYEDEVSFWKNNEPNPEYLPVFENRLKEAILIRANLGLALIGLKKSMDKVKAAREEAYSVFEEYKAAMVKISKQDEELSLKEITSLLKKKN